ncbi:TonB-dependent receptor domain-containing protein [Thiohalorhabdus methylotrophus]|uniref:TonB-dependent receptor domain-containing protein n=1 Tax=Thiohalorhabdus methylotrophus TaxID=3242694 RepID=A0ABV4TSY1_9GAMM
MRKLTPGLAACTGSLLALTGTPAAGQTVAALDEITVTATRTAQTVDDALAPVTIIDREDIEQSQAQDFQDLLRGRVGVGTSNQGGYGKQTNVYLRGTNPEHVQVLVDGVEMGSATAGRPAWEYLPLSQVERVEVVRGPRSSLYGSDAIGGIVQIFTKEGEPGIHPYVSAGAGSNRTRKARAGVSGAAGDFHYALNGGYFRTEGFDSLIGNEPDDDGYRNASGSLRIGYDPGGLLGVDASFLRAEGESEYDRAAGFGGPNETEFVEQAANTTFTLRPAHIWTARLKLAESRDLQDNFSDGVAGDTFDTIRRQASLQNDLALGADQLLTLGADYQRDLVDSTNDFTEDARWNYGVFAQHQARFGSHDLTASVRRDENEAFGAHTTWNAAWGYQIDAVWRATASYGTGFREPTFNDLYYPDVGYFEGNPDLEPEKSRSADIGLVATPDWGRVELHAFRTDIDDILVFSGTRMQNLDEARITGAEVAVRTDLGPWRVSTDVTLLDPIDEETGNLLPRRSRSSARIDARRTFGPVTAGAQWIAQGYRYDDASNDTRLPGYGLINLYGSVALGDSWKVNARVENLFDKDYQEIADYRTRGRYGVVELSYAPAGGV